MRTARLSASEITRAFLGVPESSRNHHLLEEPRLLTAAARFVLRQARKHLGQSEAGPCSPPCEDDFLALVRAIEDNEGEELSERERATVVAVLAASFDRYDVLSPLVADPAINDIIVRAYDDVSVQRHRENTQTDIRFADRDSYAAFVEHLLKRAGRACTVATPVVDAAIDANVRACVTHESFSPPGSGPMLTLRIARHRSISLDGLSLAGLAPKPILDYLRVLTSCGCATMLVAGEVGTGKTTLVKALAHEVPVNQAILIIEDTHEISLKRKFVRTLLTREANSEGAGRITPAQAIRAGMRMAMNRLILGEMRDAEAAEAFIDVCASGHAGMSTIHARSGRDALNRLQLFLARRQGNIGDAAIRRQIANAVSVVVFLGLEGRPSSRRILEVLEVGTSSDGPIQASPVFRALNGGKSVVWRRESSVSMFHDELTSAGVRLPPAGTLLRMDTVAASDASATGLHP